MSSKGIFEIEISLIPPPEGGAIASLCRPNIKISAGSVTNIVYELIGAASVIFIGVFTVFGLREGEVAFARRAELCELMDLVLGEEAAVMVADVGVPSCAV